MVKREIGGINALKSYCNHFGASGDLAKRKLYPSLLDSINREIYLKTLRLSEQARRPIAAHENDVTWFVPLKSRYDEPINTT